MITSSLMGQDKCRDVFREAWLDLQIEESSLCAVSETGDSFKGDSVGGLVIQNLLELYNVELVVTHVSMIKIHSEIDNIIIWLFAVLKIFGIIGVSTREGQGGPVGPGGLRPALRELVLV